MDNIDKGKVRFRWLVAIFLCMIVVCLIGIWATVADNKPHIISHEYDISYEKPLGELWKAYQDLNIRTNDYEDKFKYLQDGIKFNAHLFGILQDKITNQEAEIGLLKLEIEILKGTAPVHQSVYYSD